MTLLREPILSQDVLEVRKAFLLATVAVVLAGLVLFGLSDTGVSLADTGVPNNGATSSVSKASNSLASAAITITMTGMPSK